MLAGISAVLHAHSVGPNLSTIAPGGGFRVLYLRTAVTHAQRVGALEEKSERPRQPIPENKVFQFSFNY